LKPKKITYIVLFAFILTLLGATPLNVSGTPVEYNGEVQEWLTQSGNYQRTSFIPQELPLNNGSLNLKWSRFLGERIEVQMQPLVTNDMVYIGLMNGKLYALDRSNGDTVWVFDAGMGLANTPSITFQNGERRIYFGSMNGKFYCLDAETGEEIWQYQTGGPILSTPAYHADQIFVGSLDHYFYAFDASSGEVNWKFESSAPIANTSALSDQIRKDKPAIFFASGDNVAYALTLDGKLKWTQQMGGAYTKRTQAVFAEGSVIFVTRKPGREYTEHLENVPEILKKDGRQPGDVVLEAWADYYLDYPLRRTLYIFDAATGEDRWNPEVDKTAYVPLYIPYWGQITPVIDRDGNAWFAASGGGGDGGLDHDLRFWKLDLSDGGYAHIAHQVDFLHRFDETGRPTMAASRFFTTISEDIGYFDTQSLTRNNSVFGNGFHSHRAPLEFSAPKTTQIFGGMEKHFTRFAGSTPGGFAGAADSPSQLVIAGNEAFFTTWGHIYALTAQRVQPVVDYGEIDLAGPPSTTLTREQAQELLNQQVQAIISADQSIPPASRMWSWGHLSPGSFWHSGEVIRSLVDTLPYLDRDVALHLKDYLTSEVLNHLLEPRYYEYRYACIDFDSQSVLDPCPTDDKKVSTGWFWSNHNLTSERLYALYRYAVITEDWGLIVQNWNFIRSQYAGFYDSWDEEAGFFLFPEWMTAPFKPSLQMSAAFAVSEMAGYVNDKDTQRIASGHLKRMQSARVDWGKYVRGLYDTGELERVDIEGWEEIGYDPKILIIPVEGYLDKDNEFRQIYRIYRDEDDTLQVDFAAPRNEIYPFHLIGYHPIIPEFAGLIRENLHDELHDYVSAIEMISPFWYMNDYSHAVILTGHEEDSLSPVVVNDIFLAKAYIFECNFEELAPYLPWLLENHQENDIYRIQHLTALLSAKPQTEKEPARSICSQESSIPNKEQSQTNTLWRNPVCCCDPYRCRQR
jgi:outer membrane protein assembly factor BamB